MPVPRKLNNWSNYCVPDLQYSACRHRCINISKCRYNSGSWLMLCKFMMIVNGHLICGYAVTSLQHCSLLLNHRCCHSEKNIYQGWYWVKKVISVLFFGLVYCMVIDTYHNAFMCCLYVSVESFPHWMRSHSLLISLLPQAASSLPDTGCIGCKASGLMSCFPLALRMGAVVSLVKQTSFKGACFAVWVPWFGN